MARIVHQLMAIRTKDRLNRFVLLIPVLFLFTFYFFPLIKIAYRSLMQTDSLFAINDENMRIAWRSIRFSFLQAFLSTVITACLGVPAAYLFGRFIFPGRKIMRLISTLPFILPTVVVAAAFNALVGKNGWINLFLMRFFDLSQAPIQLFGTLGAILLAHVFYNTSIFIRVVGTAWERLDTNMEDAARVLSASPWQTFTKVTFPLLLPSIISAILLVFLFDFTSFGVILLMGGAQFATIEVEIYIQTTQFLNLRLAGLLSLIQLFFSIITALISKRLDNASFVPIIPASIEKALRKPDTCRKKMFVFFMNGLLFILIAMPLGALILRSVLTPGNIGSHDTLDFSSANYQRIFVNERDALFFVPPFTALRNSVLFALAAMVISIIMAICVAVGSSWSSRVGKIMDVFVMLPLGTSAVTLGLGFLLAFSASRAMVAYFPVLIPVAHSLIALPIVVRIIQPALQAIPSNQHDAAIMLGVPYDKLWWKLDLPMIRKPLITAAIYAFAVSLGEFGATTFLSRPEIPTLPVAIFRYIGLPGQENYGKAMAMAVILLLACTAGFVVIENLQDIPVRE